MWAGHMLTLRMDAFMNVKSGCNTQLHGIICGWNLQQWVCGTHLHWLWVEHVIVSRLNTHTLRMNGQGTHRWDGGSTLMTSRRNTIRWWVGVAHLWWYAVMCTAYIIGNAHLHWGCVRPWQLYQFQSGQCQMAAVIRNDTSKYPSDPWWSHLSTSPQWPTYPSHCYAFRADSSSWLGRLCWNG